MTMAMLVVAVGVVDLASVKLGEGPPTPVRDLARMTMMNHLEGTGAVANITKSTRRSTAANTTTERGATAAVAAEVQALAGLDLDHASEVVIKRIERSDTTKIARRSTKDITRRAKITRRNPLGIITVTGRGIDTTNITMIQHRTHPRRYPTMNARYSKRAPNNNLRQLFHPLVVQGEEPTLANTA